MIEIKFFGRLADAVGERQLTLDIDSPATVASLRQRLQQRFAGVADLLAEGQALVAANQDFADDSQIVSKGDEVAFFPPVTGG